jgi:hypothetical protein
MFLEEYDRIRAGIAANGLTPQTETRIALFLCGCKAVNLPFLSAAALAPATSPAWQALNTQLFRESEALALLIRVTRWAADPLLLAQNAQLTAPLYAAFAWAGLTSGSDMRRDGLGLEALALGHALLACIRLAPILPAGPVSQSPFAVALLGIEQENGRLLQTQIRLLKDGYADTPVDERETVIGRKSALVEGVFQRFLATLG